MSKPFVLTIPTMTCGHCVRTIQSALTDVYPSGAKVDLKAQQITLETPLSSLNEILRALAEAGYSPSSIHQVQTS